MLVYGGQTKNGADQSLWQFNVTTLRWTKVNKISSWSYQMIKGNFEVLLLQQSNAPLFEKNTHFVY